MGGNVTLDERGCARVDGKDYVRVGDKLVECEFVNGQPVAKSISKITKHADGRQDVTVTVPCLQITAKSRYRG